MPQPLPATIPRWNNLLSRILIAVDDSEHSAPEDVVEDLADAMPGGRVTGG